MEKRKAERRNRKVGVGFRGSGRETPVQEHSIGMEYVRKGIWKEGVQEEGTNSECKGPEAAACFVRLRNSEETNVGRTGNGGKSGDEVRGNRQCDL